MVMSLYKNIHAKRKRIKEGSGEKMRKPGEEGAPSSSDFKKAAYTAKKPMKPKRGQRTKTNNKTRKSK